MFSPLGREKGRLGTWGQGKGRPSSDVKLSHTFHHAHSGAGAAREKPASPVMSTWGLAPDLQACVLLSHFNWVWKVQFGNLGGRISISTVVALRNVCLVGGGGISVQTGRGGGRGQLSSQRALAPG